MVSGKALYTTLHIAFAAVAMVERIIIIAGRETPFNSFHWLLIEIKSQFPFARVEALATNF